MNHGHNGKQPMSAKSGKRVKAAVRSTLRPIEQRQNAIDAKLSDMERALAEINAMHAGGAEVHANGPPPSEGERHYAEWRAKQHAARQRQAEIEASYAGYLGRDDAIDHRTDDKDATILVSFASDSTWDDDAPLEPVDPSRYPVPESKIHDANMCMAWIIAKSKELHERGQTYFPDDRPFPPGLEWIAQEGTPGIFVSADGEYVLTPFHHYKKFRLPHFTPCNPTPATSPTPIPVPVPIGRLAMIRKLLTGIGYVTGAVFVASGIVAWSTLIGLKTGTVELSTVVEAGTVINEHLGWMLTGTIAANVGNVARQVLPWVIATRRASAARLSTLEEQLAKLSEQLAK